VKCALYIRVSTSDQNPELQSRELGEYAGRQSWPIVETYQDTVSGSKTSRPALNQFMADARARKFDCVLCWKLDRFGRSLVDCLTNIQILDNCGVRFIAVTQALDTDQRNPASRFLLHVLGAAAEFERSLIAERTQAGRKRYREDYDNGKVGSSTHSRSGKDLAPHRPRKVFDRDRVLQLHGEGLSLRQIAGQLHIGVGTVSRTLAERSKSTRLERGNPVLREAELLES
jgi:DNA invertase Pin-like site-specific DNA recombinase